MFLALQDIWQFQSLLEPGPCTLRVGERPAHEPRAGGATRRVRATRSRALGASHVLRRGFLTAGAVLSLPGPSQQAAPQSACFPRGGHAVQVRRADVHVPQSVLPICGRPPDLHSSSGARPSAAAVSDQRRHTCRASGRGASEDSGRGLRQKTAPEDRVRGLRQRTASEEVGSAARL